MSQNSIMKIKHDCSPSPLFDKKAVRIAASNQFLQLRKCKYAISAYVNGEAGKAFIVLCEIGHLKENTQVFRTLITSSLEGLVQGFEMDDVCFSIDEMLRNTGVGMRDVLITLYGKQCEQFSSKVENLDCAGLIQFEPLQIHCGNNDVLGAEYLAEGMKSRKVTIDDSDETEESILSVKTKLRYKSSPQYKRAIISSLVKHKERALTYIMLGHLAKSMEA